MWTANIQSFLGV